MVSDKAYSVELRLPLVSYLTANAAQCAAIAQVSTGLSVPVTARTYWFEADVLAAAQSTNLMYLTMAGPSTSAFLANIKYEQLFSGTAGTAEHVLQVQASIGTNTGLSSNALVNGQNYWTHIQGFVTFTASGNLVVNQATQVNAAAFTVQAGSVLRAWGQ